MKRLSETNETAPLKAGRNAATDGNARGRPALEAGKSKSMAVAYLLWFFLGILGAHRFYLGRVGSAFVFLLLVVLYCAVALAPVLFPFFFLGAGVIAIEFYGLLTLVLPGTLGVWWVVDAFLIPALARRSARRNA